MSSRIYLGKRRVDYMVPYLGVRKSLSLASEIDTHDVPHFFVKAWLRWNEICQNFEDYIKDSQ